VGVGVVGLGALGYLYRKGKIANSDRASKLSHQASDEINKGKLDEAIAHLSEALELKVDVKYYLNRSSAYVRLKRFEEAYDDATTAYKMEFSKSAFLPSESGS